MQQQPVHQRQYSSPARGEEIEQSQQNKDFVGSPSQEQDYEQYNANNGGSPEGEDQISKKLVGSRVARKKAEEDVLLLANRIALLKQEEQKAWKKIEDTKKKAKEIMQVKQRNIEQQKFKEQRHKEKEQEEKMLLERNQIMKNNMKETIQMSKEQHQKKLFEEAERLKQEKLQQKQLKELQQQQEQLKNASIKQQVKSQEQQTEEKKRQEQSEKKAKMRQDLFRKISDENERRLAIESEVSQLEQEELLLISKLQNTQLIQKNAYEDLENALNGNMSPEQLMQSQSSQGKTDSQREFSPIKSIGSDQKGGRPKSSGGSSSKKYTPQNAGK